MEELQAKLVNTLTVSQARYSCPDLAQLFGLTDRQIRYALQGLKSNGYEVEFIKKKVVLRKQTVGADFDEASCRQLFVLCWLAAQGRRGCEEIRLRERLAIDLGVHEQTLKRDLDLLLSEGYISENAGMLSLSPRLASQVLLTNHDLGRLLQLVLDFGHRLDNPELARTITYKLIMLRPDLLDYLEQREKLDKRIFVIGGDALEEDGFSPVLSTIRVAIMNKLWLRTGKGDIEPLQLIFSKPLGVWYVVGRKLPKTTPARFRVSGLGQVTTIAPEMKIPHSEPKGYPSGEIIEFEVYPDFSEQKKVLAELTGLNYVQILWNENGTMRVTMQGEHREDFIRWLRLFGPSLKVLRPEYLRRQLMGTAERVISQYANVGLRSNASGTGLADNQ